MIRFVQEMKPINWPKDFQKYHIYINEEGMYELLEAFTGLRSQVGVSVARKSSPEM